MIYVLTGFYSSAGDGRLDQAESIGVFDDANAVHRMVATDTVPGTDRRLSDAFDFVHVTCFNGLNQVGFLPAMSHGYLRDHAAWRLLNQADLAAMSGADEPGVTNWQ